MHDQDILQLTVFATVFFLLPYCFWVGGSSKCFVVWNWFIDYVLSLLRDDLMSLFLRENSFDFCNFLYIYISKWVPIKHRRIEFILSIINVLFRGTTICAYLTWYANRNVLNWLRNRPHMFTLRCRYSAGPTYKRWCI